MDFLTHPYVIIFIVLAVIISNIMALKYTAHTKFPLKKKPAKEEKEKEEETQKNTPENHNKKPPPPRS